MPNKLFYVCLDGLGDDPLEELGGRTPVEAAATPFLDDLARRGRQGLVHTVGPDIAPESDIAVFAILGYDPREEHPGRGVLEAIGTGRNAEPSDAGQVIGLIRLTIADLFDGDVAQSVRIQYGGSVKAGNIRDFMAHPEIDGALVGGASLDPEELALIVKYR